MAQRGPKKPSTEEERLALAMRKVEAEFDRRLDNLKSPETRARIDAVMKAQGRSKRRPIAGTSY